MLARAVDTSVTGNCSAAVLETGTERWRLETVASRGRHRKDKGRWFQGEKLSQKFPFPKAVKTMVSWRAAGRSQ